ncbi:cupin domain-containing protein [Mycobacterium avium]|uniref:cupin domain-containing protein n=1 Tax=Mycobacterium avium TaxID=1764 RepID=UPI00111C5FCE|nr:cupin domain-containing protein [Mycobacterium avium]
MALPDIEVNRYDSPGQRTLRQERANAPAYWLIDIVWYILVDGEDSGGSFSLIEQYMREGSGPIPHVHAFIDEWFYVLEGKIDFTVGDDRFTAGPGDSLWIPRNTVHVFTSMTDCHVLNAYTPAGFEQVVKRLWNARRGPRAAAQRLPASERGRISTVLQQLLVRSGRQELVPAQGRSWPRRSRSRRQRSPMSNPTSSPSP